MKAYLGFFLREMLILELDPCLPLMFMKLMALSVTLYTSFSCYHLLDDHITCLQAHKNSQSFHASSIICSEDRKQLCTTAQHSKLA
jgi:hypothetical protein